MECMTRNAVGQITEALRVATRVKTLVEPGPAERQFNIMALWGMPSPPPLHSIPWSVIAPCEKQAIINHNQTLEVLNSRGGLTACEAVAVLEGRRWHPMGFIEAYERLGTIVLQRIGEAGAGTGPA